MTAKDPLALYPNIQFLHKSNSCPIGKMEELVTFGNASIPLLEKTIPLLFFHARPSLTALSKDLFSKDIKKVNAAICEILAFGWLKQNGILSEEDIGYPAEWITDDPPFEGRLRHNGSDLAFDVKDGSGSGHSLLWHELSKVLAEEASAASVIPPQIDIGFNAPTGQRWFEENFAAITKQFRESLKADGFAQRRQAFSAGSGSITVGLDCSAGGSLSGVSEKASFIAHQVLTHAKAKSRRLQANTKAFHFMLVYVRRPHTGGADFDMNIMPYIFDFLAGMSDLPASLSGVLFINFESKGSGDSAETVVWDRAGLLPPGLMKAVDKVYKATSKPSLRKHQAAARMLDPADVISLEPIVLAACDLRGPECTARGKVDAVHSFKFAEKFYFACSKCVQHYKWPTL